MPYCTSSTVLNRRDENRHPYFVSRLSRKAFCISPLKGKLDFRIFIHSLSDWGSSFLFLVCCEFFLMNIWVYQVLVLQYIYIDKIMYFFPLFFYLFFWPRHVACRILVPWPGIEPRPRQWKRRVLTTGPPGNSPFTLLMWQITLIDFQM